MPDLPSDARIEAELLSSCSTEDSDILKNVRTILTEADFSVDDNRTIYRALCALVDSGRATTYVEIFNWCQEHQRPITLSRITSTDPFPWAVDGYIRRLRELSLRRRLMIAGNDIMHAAADLTADLPSVFSRASGSVTAVSEDRMGEEVPEDLDGIIQAAGGVEQFLRERRGIMTPWNELNQHTCGWHNGELILIGARPSMGKTALALNAILKAGRVGVPSVFYSFEMTRESIFHRLICLIANISYNELLSGNLDPEARFRVQGAVAQISELPIRVVGASGRTALSVRVHAERLNRRGQCGFVVVDYIGIIRAADSEENRSRQLGKVARELKETAATLNIPVLALAQLNRQTATRDDKRPGLPDLRDSGELEEHADMVAFLHRPGYYNRNDPALERVAELIIAKQRNGDTPLITLEYHRNCGKFTDANQQEDSRQARFL